MVVVDRRPSNRRLIGTSIPVSGDDRRPVHCGNADVGKPSGRRGVSELRRVAVVTGAGRGIGRASAVALADAGLQVVVNDADGDTASAVATEIVERGGDAMPHLGTVGPTEAAEDLLSAAVRRFGRIDVLVANAGILRDRVVWDMTDDDFDSVVTTHLRGTFTCARAAIRQMRAQRSGGRLILVSSTAGQRGNLGQTNYAAAKAGIVAMARTWAVECRPFRITVNAILPMAATRMVASIPGMDRLVAAAERGEPLPEALRSEYGLGTPQDVAPVVAYLASDRAARVTGQCIGIGGDRLALWTTPQEAVVELRPGGWTTEAIANAWDSRLSASAQPFGMAPPVGTEWS